MDLRSELHLRSHLGNTDSKFMPKACYQMNAKERDDFCKVIKELKLPDECSSNISKCVQLRQHKLVGLKSYDYHVLIEEILPIAIPGSFPDHVSLAIIDLCNFFKELYSKVLDVDNLEWLQSRVALTLCQMEKIFHHPFSQLWFT